MSRYEEFLMGVNDRKFSSIEVMGESLKNYGDSAPVWVLVLYRTPEIMETRDIIGGEFDKFLRSCGVGNPDHLIGQTRFLKYFSRELYSPHISLVRPWKKNVKMLEPDVDGVIVKLAEPTLYNARVVDLVV